MQGRRYGQQEISLIFFNGMLRVATLMISRQSMRALAFLQAE